MEFVTNYLRTFLSFINQAAALACPENTGLQMWPHTNFEVSSRCLSPVRLTRGWLRKIAATKVTLVR